MGMRSYSVRDVERVLQLAPGATRSLIRAGFVHPARGPRLRVQFSEAFNAHCARIGYEIGADFRRNPNSTLP